MTAISRWLDEFCYRHPKFGIPHLMRYIIIGNIIVYVLDIVSNATFSAILSFVPSLVLQGQVWRLITFVIVPEYSSNIFLFALVLYFYYFIGDMLEKQWGTTKFSVFYLSGIILNIAAGLIAAALLPDSYSTFTVNMYYVNMSMFFAMASLFPDMQVLLFFIIPLKAKWLAWMDAALFVIDIIRYIAGGIWPMALLPAVAFINYLLFFGDDVFAVFGGRPHSRTVRNRTSGAKVIKFNKASKKFKAESDGKKPYYHKCTVCGRTDTDYPNLEFRYCSKCRGYYCYCEDHINNHVHIT